MTAHSGTLTRREEGIVLFSWQQGREYGHREVAEAIADLQAVPDWLPTPRSHEVRVAERLRLFEDLAAKLHERIGTREFRGTDSGDRVTPW